VRHLDFDFDFDFDFDLEEEEEEEEERWTQDFEVGNAKRPHRNARAPSTNSERTLAEIVHAMEIGMAAPLSKFLWETYWDCGV